MPFVFNPNSELLTQTSTWEFLKLHKYFKDTLTFIGVILKYGEAQKQFLIKKHVYISFN